MNFPLLMTSPERILSTNACRVIQVSLALCFKFKTNLIINLIEFEFEFDQEFNVRVEFEV